LEEQGFREIVITGIEICSYGKDLDGGMRLTDVVREIGSAAPLLRLRLGSLDPVAVTKEFCDELFAVRNLCAHFHLSLQSGCDGVLRRMGRKYDTKMVGSAIGRLRHMFPDCGITADLIVGFPGETDEEFEQTLSFIKETGFSDMHIFPYSKRPGTPAATMSGQIEKKVRTERARIVTRVAKDMAHDFRLAQIGKTTEVLFEQERDGHWVGHTGNYVEVKVKNGGPRNSMHMVKITGVEKEVVFGEIVSL